MRLPSLIITAAGDLLDDLRAKFPAYGFTHEVIFDPVRRAFAVYVVIDGLQGGQASARGDILRNAVLMARDEEELRRAIQPTFERLRQDAEAYVTGRMVFEVTPR